MLVRRAILTGRVTFGCLLVDETITDSFCFFVADRCLRFGAGLQRRASATKSVGDKVTAVLLFDARLINFIRRALSKVESNLLHRFVPSDLLIEMKKPGGSAGLKLVCDRPYVQ